MSKPLGIANYYTGVVIAVTPDDDDRLENDKEWHEVLIDIPGVIQGVKAFPFRDELDEPKINDKVLVLDVDPLYHSYFLYRKLKEDGFIGFRSSGKMVSITPDDITIGVFGPNDNDEYPDYAEDEVPDCDPGDDGSGNGCVYAKFTKAGDIEIKAKGNCNINISGDSGCTVNIKGNSEVNVDGDTTLTCKGDIALLHDNLQGDPSEAMNSLEDGVVFGEELKTQLDALNSKVDEVITGVNAAITQSAPAPFDGGTTLKATMLASWLPSYIKLQAQKVMAATRALPSMPNTATQEPNFNFIVNKNVKTKGNAT